MTMAVESAREAGRVPNVPTTTELAKKVDQIIAQCCLVNDAQVQPLARLREDLGACWQDLVAIIVYLEKEFDIEIADEQFFKLETCFQVTTFVHMLVLHKLRPRT